MSSDNRTRQSATVEYVDPGDPSAWRGVPLQQLPLTGERTVPGVAHENYWFRRHEAVYEQLAERVRSARVLEVGCGEGYGSALLARFADHLVGVDYDELAIEHCHRSYPGADFVRANLAALPVPDGGVDVVVCLQVIEHVWDIPQFVDECARVLRPGGRFLVSTPNRLTFSPDNDGTRPPDNPFHTHEFVADELARLLTARGFGDVVVAGLHAGERLRALDERYGSFVAAQLATAPARWSPQLAAQVASVTTADFVLEVDDGEIDGLVGRRYPGADRSLDLVLSAER